MKNKCVFIKNYKAASGETKSGEVPYWMEIFHHFNEESFKKFMERAEKINKENITCNCGGNTADVGGNHCVDCWKLLPNWKYIWVEPSRNNKRWLILDRKSYWAARMFFLYQMGTTMTDTWLCLRYHFFWKQAGIPIKELFEKSNFYMNKKQRYNKYSKKRYKTNKIDMPFVYMRRHTPQKSECPDCKDWFKFEDMELHHKQSRSNDGIENYDNLVLLCKNCHYKYLTELLICD